MGGVPGSPAPSRGSGDERSRSPTSSPLTWEGTRDLLFRDFPLTSLRSPAGVGEGRGGGQGWTVRHRSAAPGASCRPRSPRVRTPPEPRKLQRAFRRRSRVSRRDRAPQHQSGTRSGRAGLRRRVAASPGALPAPAAGAGAASASLSPSSIPTCRSPAGHPFPAAPWISAAPEREGMRGWWLSAGVSAGQAHASRSRSPTGAGCGLVFHSVRGGCLPRARCLTDPFLNSAGRAELQPLLTLHSN